MSSSRSRQLIRTCVSRWPAAPTRTTFSISSSSIIQHPLHRGHCNTQASFFSTTSNNSNDDNIDKTESKSSSILSDEWIPPSSANTKKKKNQQEDIQVSTRLDLPAQGNDNDPLFTIQDDDDDDTILQKLEAALAQEEAQEEALRLQQTQALLNPVSVPDWQQTRRQALGGRAAEESSIPVIPNTLLTSDEISEYIGRLGATEVVTIWEDPEQPRLGSGVQGMVVGTGENAFHLQRIAQELVHHLQDRQLTVPAVDYKPTLYDESWIALDCGNFLVQLLDSKTREALKLEDLWSGKDPVWNLQWHNEDAVEEYIAQHPVPTHILNLEESASSSSLSHLRLAQLEKSKWAGGRPMLPKKQSKKKRRGRR